MGVKHRGLIRIFYTQLIVTSKSILHVITTPPWIYSLPKLQIQGSTVRIPLETDFISNWKNLHKSEYYICVWLNLTLNDLLKSKLIKLPDEHKNAEIKVNGVQGRK